MNASKSSMKPLEQKPTKFLSRVQLRRNIECRNSSRPKLFQTSNQPKVSPNAK